MTDEKLREARTILEELFRSTFPETEFTSVRVRPDLDLYGDEMLSVEAFYRGGSAEPYSQEGADFLLEMRDRLCAIGIDAFPMHYFRSSDEEPLDGRTS